MIPFINFGANNLIAFLMLYAIVVLIKRLKITFESNKLLFIGLMLVPYVMAIMSMIVLDLLGRSVEAARIYSCYYMRGNFRPVSMLVSVGLFIWGTTWRIKTNKLVDDVAETTFGIYLFHMYPPIMELLFEKVFLIERVINEPYAALYVIAVTIIIFMSGVLIDLVRRMLFSCCTIVRNRIQTKNKLST